MGTDLLGFQEDVWESLTRGTGLNELRKELSETCRPAPTQLSPSWS